MNERDIRSKTVIFQFVSGETVEVPEIPFKEEVHLDANRTALVIVDMQNDFVNPLE